MLSSQIQFVVALEIDFAEISWRFHQQTSRSMHPGKAGVSETGPGTMFDTMLKYLSSIIVSSA